MALTSYGDLQFRYNSYEDTEIKDYLPIIGNEIPNKLIANFDELVKFTCTAGTGNTDNGLDKRLAYRSTACRKVTVATTANLTMTYTLAAATDLTSLSASVPDGFAQVTRTGKYLSGGTSYKDTFHFVLNIGHYYASSAATPAKVSLTFYNGTKTATLKSAEQKTLADQTAYARDTYQFAMDSTHFDYASGFAAADWESITKFDIVIVKGNQNLYAYFHNANVAIPKYETTHCTDSYYPEITASNSYFISRLFGDDANAGTRAAPVKTIEKALALIDAAGAGYTYAVIIDSEKYKPIATDYSYGGIKQTLDRNTTIIADYLETPSISAEAGLFNSDRVGARLNYRTHFSTPNITVGASGADYTTIGAAYTAASAGQVIEIIDDGVYDETLTSSKYITIQARAGKRPTWKYSSGATILDMTGSSIGVVLRGIIFEGRNTNGDKLIKSADAAPGGPSPLIIQDCTFTKCGTSSGASHAIYFQQANGAEAITIENCLFVENGEYFIAFECIAGATGIIKFVNCAGYMGSTTNNYFIKAGKANTSSTSIIVLGSLIWASADAAANYVYYAGDSAAAAGYTKAYFFMNDLKGSIIYNSYANSVLMSGLVYGNYFHDISRASADALIYVASLSTTAVSVLKNLFYNIDIDSAGVITAEALVYYANTNCSTSYVAYNIFKNCGKVCVLTGSSADPWANVFVDCEYAHYSSTTRPASNCIFLNCTYGIAGSVFSVTYSLYYNAPADSASYGTGCLNSNPEFVDADKLNFGWYFDSAIESNSRYMDFVSPFIYAAGTVYYFDFKYIEFSGGPGTAIGSQISYVRPTYCEISGFTIGLLSAAGQMAPQNCYITGCGQGIRYSNTSINTMPACKYNVFKGNNTGILLRSGAAIDYCTIIGGDYGIAGVFSGFYALDEYIRDYLTITNSIIFDNDVYDYYYTLPTDYCIIGTRYYDQLLASDLDYKDTVGAHDITSNPTLTDEYFPGLKVLGYKEDSPAYNAASTAGQNIGARYVNRIKAVFTYSSYTIAANPNESSIELVPINLEDGLDVSGEYDSNSDTETEKMALIWTEPGRKSKIMEAQKTAMTYVYQTYWLVGISTDDGSTWNYYKVNKSANPSYKQIGFYYAELPVGEWTMEFYKMPDTFEITDYTVNTMES